MVRVSKEMDGHAATLAQCRCSHSNILPRSLTFSESGGQFGHRKSMGCVLFSDLGPLAPDLHAERRRLVSNG